MRFLLVTLAIALASPALAQGRPGGFLSADDAGLIARDYGVAKIQQIELDDGIWEVDGRDARGGEFDVEIDAATGAVVKIERD